MRETQNKNTETTGKGADPKKETPVTVKESTGLIWNGNLRNTGCLAVAFAYTGAESASFCPTECRRERAGLAGRLIASERRTIRWF